MRPFALIAVMFVAPSAWAHDADIVSARAERGEAGVVREQLTLTAATLELLAPVDADDDGLLTDADLEARADALAAGVWDQLPLRSPAGQCERTKASARIHNSFVQLDAEFRCGGGELLQTFKILSVLPSGYRVVVGGDFAQGNQQTLTVLGSEAAPAQARGPARGLWGWVSLGIEHIFLGFDHLAFLFAVLLVGGNWKRILLLVSSFTLAHTLTLAGTAFGVVRLGPRAGAWVEVAIALSIVWIALENLILRQHRHRAALTFAFGLVHGFGFASALRDYGLEETVVTGLFGFNLGVELGQAAIVLALSPLMRLVARRAIVERWTVRLASLAILAAGAFWVIERVPR